MKENKTKITRKRTGISKERLVLIKKNLIAIVAILVLAICFFMINSREKNSIPLHDYDLDKVSEKNGFRYYQDKNYDSKVAIDVSFFQGDINWEKVRQAGVEYAYIRVGYRSKDDGKLHLDSKFKQNIEGAKKAGIKVGVYFFSQSINRLEAGQDASFILEKIKNYKIDLEVAFDMEYVGESCRISNLDNETRTKIAMKFCDVIESQGYKSIIYGNPTYLLGSVEIVKLKDYDFWLAHYTDSTDYKYKFKVWQYSDSGIVDGIDHKVDLNIIFKEKEKDN